MYIYVYVCIYVYITIHVRVHFSYEMDSHLHTNTYERGGDKGTTNITSMPHICAYLVMWNVHLSLDTQCPPVCCDAHAYIDTLI